MKSERHNRAGRQTEKGVFKGTAIGGVSLGFFDKNFFRTLNYYIHTHIHTPVDSFPMCLTTCASLKRMAVGPDKQHTYTNKVPEKVVKIEKVKCFYFGQGIGIRFLVLCNFSTKYQHSISGQISTMY